MMSATIVVSALIASPLLVVAVLGYLRRKRRVRVVRLAAQSIHETWNRHYQLVHKPGAVLATSDWLVAGSEAETQFLQDVQRRFGRGDTGNDLQTRIRTQVIAQKRVAPSTLASVNPDGKQAIREMS